MCCTSLCMARRASASSLLPCILFHHVRHLHTGSGHFTGNDCWPSSGCSFSMCPATLELKREPYSHAGQLKRVGAAACSGVGSA